MKTAKKIIGIALGVAAVIAIAAGPVRGALDVNQIEVEVADGVIENDLTGEENAEVFEEDGEAAAEEEYTESELRFTEDGMLILPRPVMEGKVFVEWNTEEDGSGVGYKPGEIVDPMGITLYAVWADEAAEEAPEEATPEEASYEDAVTASGGLGAEQPEVGSGVEPATEQTEVGPGVESGTEQTDEQTEAGQPEAGPGIEPETEQTTEPTTEPGTEQTIESGAEPTEEGQAIEPENGSAPEQTAEPENGTAPEQTVAEPVPEQTAESTEGGAQ